MALALKEQFQIKIVPGYQTADGKKFHDAAEAQSYTRNAMLDSVISAATKERPEFAKLEPVLLRDFLLRVGKHVGAVMAEPLTPLGMYQKMEPQVVVNATPETEAQIASLVKAAAAMPRTAHLESGRKLSVEDPSITNRGAVQREEAAILASQADRKFGEHPLRAAMTAVDESMEGSLDAELRTVLESGRV